MAKGTNVLLRFLSSNKFEDFRDRAVAESLVRYVLFNVALIIGGGFLVGFGSTVILEGNVIRGMADIFVGFLCFTAIGLLRTKLPFTGIAIVPISVFAVLCVALVMSGGEKGFAGLWIYSFPLIAIFVLGLNIGIVLSGLVLAGTMLVAFVPGLADFDYTLAVTLRIIAVYILVFALTIVYEQVRLLKDRWVKQLTSALESERDQIAAMKDSLRVGLFLLDKDYVIQPAFSRALVDIMGTDELDGKRFTALLDSSLKQKERETLEDYFGMVLNRSFDAKMLDDINPIAEFEYIDSLSLAIKTLRSNFTTVDRGYGDYQILGAIEDITEAKKLQQQLAEEEGRREEEMKALFQVIQVEPRVFGDFLEDTDYEFDRVNTILKDQKLSGKDAMVMIYQSVHAIKSNALILGLENFSGKLHELENKIRTLREKDDVSFEEVLHITVELENIMRERDKFRDIIGKIESFKGTGGRRQDRFVLIETLTKACEKASEALHKKAKFIVDDLDGEILEHGPRRVIKEILTQLVRNSVYHGIEAPEDRKAAGKESEGSVRLVIKHVGDKITINLSDDGRGLDFEKIRKKALSSKVLKNEEEAGDKSVLLNAIFAPGFSTAETADLNAGRGIGLNLVRERVRDLKGSIKVQTEPRKGTSFTITIPYEPAQDRH
ncbi:MAG: hypothetical protein LBI90_10570 [Treponema sp.]|jgi:two-component system chemotaxis sensor kinase CheA|nr:hypothetical protein [Treponema sp.]